MTSYVFLRAIEAIASEGYLSGKEIKKLTRIKKRKQKCSIQGLKSEIERLRK
jgi:hypothetical protein